jgi:tetratricopeptide (TPR) repeat protein
VDQLVSYFVAQLAASRVDGAVDEAQALIFDAWDSDDLGQRIGLAKAALKISGDCADAYVILAKDTATTTEEAIRLYSQGVAAGERALGPAAFVEDVGMFWGLLETRPYMRARAGLALALCEAGRVGEAVEHGQAMLSLNPNDNQGMRELVLDWLLRLGRDDDAAELLRRYKNDAGAGWSWSAALAAFRKHGDRAAARKALERAVAANLHVEAYLLGRKKPPRRLPDFVVMGGKEEAAAWVAATASTWAATPGALEWLAKRTLPGSPSRRPATRP